MTASGCKNNYEILNNLALDLDAQKSNASGASVNAGYDQYYANSFIH